MNTEITIKINSTRNPKTKTKQCEHEYGNQFGDGSFEIECECAHECENGFYHF